MKILLALCLFFIGLSAQARSTNPFQAITPSNEMCEALRADTDISAARLSAQLRSHFNARLVECFNWRSLRPGVALAAARTALPELIQQEAVRRGVWNSRTQLSALTAALGDEEAEVLPLLLNAAADSRLPMSERVLAMHLWTTTSIDAHLPVADTLATLLNNPRNPFHFDRALLECLDLAGSDATRALPQLNARLREWDGTKSTEEARQLHKPLLERYIKLANPRDAFGFLFEQDGRSIDLEDAHNLQQALVNLVQQNPTLQDIAEQALRSPQHADLATEVLKAQAEIVNPEVLQHLFQRFEETKGILASKVRTPQVRAYLLALLADPALAVTGARQMVELNAGIPAAQSILISRYQDTAGSDTATRLVFARALKASGPPTLETTQFLLLSIPTEVAMPRQSAALACELLDIQPVSQTTPAFERALIAASKAKDMREHNCTSKIWRLLAARGTRTATGHLIDLMLGEQNELGRAHLRDVILLSGRADTPRMLEHKLRAEHGLRRQRGEELKYAVGFGIASDTDFRCRLRALTRAIASETATSSTVQVEQEWPGQSRAAKVSGGRAWRTARQLTNHPDFPEAPGLLVTLLLSSDKEVREEVASYLYLALQSPGYIPDCSGCAVFTAEAFIAALVSELQRKRPINYSESAREIDTLLSLVHPPIVEIMADRIIQHNDY